MSFGPPDEESAELLELATSIASRAVDGEQIEACVGASSHTTVLVHGGRVESFTSATSRGVGIRVVRDHRQGFAHAGTLDADAITEALDEARDNARFAHPEEWIGLAVPDGVDPVPVDRFDASVAALSAERRIELALELERLVLAGDPHITGVRTASFSGGWGRSAIATSTGIGAASRDASCSMGVLALASRAGETTTGAGSTHGFTPGELDLHEAADDAVNRATRLFGAGPVASQRLAVVLEPRLAATIAGFLGATLTGDALVTGRSPFADRVGEVISSPLLSVVDDPTDARSFAADTFDGEGLACRRNDLVVDGVLRGFLHDTATGRRAGVPGTGSAVRSVSSTPMAGYQALVVAPGSGSFDDLVRGVDVGVYVQSMTGIHSGVNLVSGDVSVGIEGVMIRDGVFAEPVREVTIASTLQRMLLDIRAVGDDVEWLPGGTGCPTIVIGDVALSGL